MKINIVPLSVNRAWQGNRFKTDDYHAYEQELFYKLPKIDVPQCRMKLQITFGMSNYASDIDNPLKPFLDILQKKYQFNDKNICELIVIKQQTEKGQEYIDFLLSPM